MFKGERTETGWLNYYGYAMTNGWLTDVFRRPFNALVYKPMRKYDPKGTYIQGADQRWSNGTLSEQRERTVERRKVG